MSKRPRAPQPGSKAPEPVRQNRPRQVSELLPAVGGAAFRRFGFVQSSLVSRWAEIAGERFAAVSAPESLRFPPREKQDGEHAVTVRGAHAPMMQHVLPELRERVNRFFGYPAVARGAAGPRPVAAHHRRPGAESGAGVVGCGRCRHRRAAADRVMRRLLLVSALLLGAPMVTAATPRDWYGTAARLPSAAYRIGNPAARAKLVEYASYTCSHCAHFSAESEPGIKRLIRSGSTSLEFRHLIRDGLDMGAAVIARCTGPAGFAATSADIFAQQATWFPRGAEWQRYNAQRIATWPPNAQFRALADGAGLTAIGRAHGLTEQQVDACFADTAEIDRILAIRDAAPASVRATPTFFVNGRLVPGADWAHVLPALRAAGAK